MIPNRVYMFNVSDTGKILFSYGRMGIFCGSTVDRVNSRNSAS